MTALQTRSSGERDTPKKPCGLGFSADFLGMRERNTTVTIESAGRVPDQTITVELTRGQLAILRDLLHEWQESDAESGTDPGYSYTVDDLDLVLFRAEAGL